MGITNSQITRKSTNFYFGQVTLKKASNKDLLSVIRPIKNQQQFNDWKSKYQLVKIMTNKQSLFVPQSFDYRKVQNTGLNLGCCGPQTQTEMTYQDFNFTLYSQISNRKQSCRYFPQTELFLILYKFLGGAKEFQKKGLNIGDIRTKNILLTKSSQLKLVNVASMPGQHTAVEKVLDGNDRTTKYYLAPEEIRYVQEKGPASQQCPNAKSEAWSVGLCLLEAGTLECSEDMYSVVPMRKFDEGLLQKRMEMVQRRYHTFYQFLAMIVNTDSTKRLSSAECWASMKPYGEKITDLEPFSRNLGVEATSVRKYFTEGSGRR